MLELRLPEAVPPEFWDKSVALPRVASCGFTSRLQNLAFEQLARPLLCATSRWSGWRKAWTIFA